MSESWRKLYIRSGHQYVEPLEYIPAPGSVKVCNLKTFSDEEPEIACECFDDDEELYRLDE